MNSSALRQPSPGVLTFKLGLAAIVLLVVGFDMCFPLCFTFGEPVEVSNYHLALRRAKSCGVSMNLYSVEHDDTYPYVLGDEALFRAVTPYFVSQYPERWETLNRGKPGKFTMNYSLAGATSRDVMNPEETPMILDRFARHPAILGWFARPPYHSSDWVFLSSFVDGHAKYVTEAEWPRYRANLSLHLKPEGRPLE